MEVKDETLRKPGEGAPKEEVKTEKTVQTEKVEDSSKKIADLETQRAKDKAESDAKIFNLEFESNFKDVVTQYPHASDFKDKILERVKSGQTINDATLVELHGAGKLVTRQEIESQAAGERSFGGSADTFIPTGKKKPSEMTQEELRAALVEEEAKGTFKLVED
jgi:hypothetical protein